jgi:hypothetical protein
VAFLLTNTAYEHETGRLQALEMLQQVRYSFSFFFYACWTADAGCAVLAGCVGLLVYLLQLRLQGHVAFLLTNTAYEHETGRLQALEMLQQVRDFIFISRRLCLTADADESAEFAVLAESLGLPNC